VTAGGSVDPADDDRLRGLLALIAGTVSYQHMHLLVDLGQPGWVAPLTPLSVDGMIVAASPALLADSRSGGRGGFLPWALLIASRAASLAANVAVAEPTMTGRGIAAWPSFSLIAAYERLMRQVRRVADSAASKRSARRSAGPAAQAAKASAASEWVTSGVVIPQRRKAGRDVQLEAWRWAALARTLVMRQMTMSAGWHSDWAAGPMN
jgi:uncharacterized protein DUF2637